MTNKGSMSCGGCAIIAAAWAGISFLLAKWTQSNIHFWMEHFKDESVEKVGMLWCWLITFFPVTLPANIISEILEVAVK
jgi:hypothetical protein